MSKILKVNQGDYVVQVQPGGYIILDTGEVGGIKGTVTIKGNLDVQGAQTQVSSTDTAISDNIIILNSGEPGPGINVPIKNGLSGIQIDRGQIDSKAASAQLLFSETDNIYDPDTLSRSAGSFLLQTTSGASISPSNLKLKTAELRSIANSGSNSIEIDLNDSQGVVELVNSTYNLQEYHTRVTDNSLVTKKFVTSYIVAGTITVGMADVDKIYKSKLDNTEGSQILATTNSLVFSISALNIATITSNGLSVNTIKPYTGDTVTLDSVVGLSDQSTDPTVAIGKTLIYSKASVGAGNSGIFFKNNTASDELIAKNRALLLSMLF